jgi:glycosyltransferase involved in cell wall biosynthesis
MRILFLFNGIYPDGMAMSNRIHLYGKALIANSIDVNIVVPSDSNISSGGINNGVKYSYLKDPVKFRRHVLLKLNNFFAAFFYAHYSFKSAKDYDILFVTDFGWFVLSLIICGAHLGGAKVVTEVNENPYAYEGGRLDPRWLQKIHRMFILNIPFRFADGFIVISKPLKQLVAKYKKRNALIVMIPVLTNKIEEQDQIVPKPDVPFILHSGTLSESKDGVEAMFIAFAKAAKATNIPIQFILTSKIAKKNLLQKINEIIRSNKLENRIIFLGHISKEELEKYRSLCLTTIINRPVNDQNLFNFPTKLGEFLSRGIPVIATATGEMGSYLNDSETAFIVRPNDSDAIAEKILFILNNPEEAVKVGIAGRNLAEKKLYYMNYADDLALFFKNILNENRN